MRSPRGVPTEPSQQHAPCEVGAAQPSPRPLSEGHSSAELTRPRFHEREARHRRPSRCAVEEPARSPPSMERSVIDREIEISEVAAATTTAGPRTLTTPGSVRIDQGRCAAANAIRPANNHSVSVPKTL